MWKNIVGVWLNVRLGLTKSDLINAIEILRQPLFGNPSITNIEGAPLGVSSLREGYAFARSGCSRVKDLWNPERNEWKNLPELGMSYHTANIPWHPNVSTSCAQAGDWISSPAPSTGAPLDWVYHVLQSTPGKARVIKFKKTSTSGHIQATSHQAFTLSTHNYHPVRVLSQERPGTTLKVVREPPASGKKPSLYWVFEIGFIQDLPWDPGEWHWQTLFPLGDAPFFGYTAKRGYKNARRAAHTPNILTFIQRLNLQNSTTPQVIARIWHNARPRKVGTLIWLTLNQGLLVGTWLQLMGIPPYCKVCDSRVEKSSQHCLFECPMAQRAWEAYKRIWEDWKMPKDIAHS